MSSASSSTVRTQWLQSQIARPWKSLSNLPIYQHNHICTRTTSYTPAGPEPVLPPPVKFHRSRAGRPYRLNRSTFDAVVAVQDSYRTLGQSQRPTTRAQHAAPGEIDASEVLGSFEVRIYSRDGRQDDTSALFSPAVVAGNNVPVDRLIELAECGSESDAEQQFFTSPKKVFESSLYQYIQRQHHFHAGLELMKDLHHARRVGAVRSQC